jgi:hypothetical protein
MSNTPAGWHPDPHGKAKLRYWDGSAWTEHTSDGGDAPQGAVQPGAAPAQTPPPVQPQQTPAFGAAPQAAPGGGTSGGGKGKIIGAVVGGIVGVVALIVVLVLVFGEATVDKSKVENLIRKASGSEPKDINCPDDESAEKGNEFVCTVTFEGGEADLTQKVTIRIVNDDGRGKIVDVTGP